MARTGIVHREETLAHDTGRGHPERPARMTATMDALRAAGLAEPTIACELASREDLLRVHSQAHLETVEHHCRTGERYPDPDTPMGPGSWDAALLAAGGAIAGCAAVMDGEVDNAFSVMRPPGHHAERSRAMGFCLFNSVAIAARWLQAHRNMEKIAILDWDVHHGNGTQEAFYGDPSVYYASIHQHPLFPGTGSPSERGARKTNLNIQMAPGRGHEDWLEALNDQILPEFERFSPEFLLISCGFDAHQDDPLGAQRLTAQTFAAMTEAVRGLAGGNVVSLLEGGYSLDALGECAVAHVESLRNV